MGNTSSMEAEEEGTVGFHDDKLLDDTITTYREDGPNDADETFSTKSDTGQSTEIRMTRPSTDGSLKDRNEVDCPTAMTDMAHDGDDEASIEQRRIGRRRFHDLLTSSLGGEESMIILDDSYGDESSNEFPKVPVDTKKSLIVPSVDVIAPNDENNTPSMFTSTLTSDLLIVPAVDVRENIEAVAASTTETSQGVSKIGSRPFQPKSQNTVVPTSGVKHKVMNLSTEPESEPKLTVVVGSDVLIQHGSFNNGCSSVSQGHQLAPYTSIRNGWPSSSDDSGVLLDRTSVTKQAVEAWKNVHGAPAYSFSEALPQDREVVEICDDGETQREAESVASARTPTPIMENPLELQDVEGVDMDLVRSCQGAFVKFLSKYPHLAEHPGIETMLILKLQTVFSVVHQIEADLSKHIVSLKAQKEILAQDFHTKLIIATKKKAARKLELHNFLNKAQNQNRNVEWLIKHNILLWLRTRARKIQEIQENSAKEESLGQLVNIPQEYIPSIRSGLGQGYSAGEDLSHIVSKTVNLRAEVSSLEQKAGNLGIGTTRINFVNDALLKLSDEELASLAKQAGSIL